MPSNKNTEFCLFFLLTRTCPDYYNVVSEPIDLLKIQQKLKTDEYETVEQLTEDIGLLVNNAKAYYKVTALEPYA